VLLFAAKDFYHKGIVNHFLSLDLMLSGKHGSKYIAR